MAGSADLFLIPSKMYGLDEQKLNNIKDIMSAVEKTPDELSLDSSDQLKGNGSNGQSWAKSEEGKATLAGAAEGMKSGSIGNTLTSAGIYNMLGAGGFTPMGGAMAAGGVILNAIDQGNAVDYANRKLVADQQAAAQKNKVAALYQMMGRNYGIS